jgi:hypothetical protein
VVEESIEAADFPISSWTPQPGDTVAFDLEINVGGSTSDAGADASADVTRDDAMADASAADAADAGDGGDVGDAGDASQSTSPVCTMRLGQFLLHAGPTGCARPEREVCGFCQPMLLAP